MTNSLSHWQEKIKNKRKNTNFIKYLKEICSWIPIELYKNNWNISRYPETNRSPKVISNLDYTKTRDQSMDYGLDYDLSKSFADNFGSLFKNIPLSATISQMAGENTQYADVIVSSTNCYLSNMIIDNCENIFYTFQSFENCKNIFSSVSIYSNSENIYMSSGVTNGFKVFYSKYIINSNNIWFSSNLIWCSECILCDDLENQKYCIENKEYEKEEYLEKKKEILKNKNDFLSKLQNIKVKWKNFWSTDVTWNFIEKSSDVENGFYIADVSKSRNILFSWWTQKESYDVFDTWINVKDMYGVASWWVNSENIYLSSQIESCYNIFYSYYLNNSNHCFACIWLQNQSFCILNKQYTKEDWYKKVNQIFEKMDNNGTLWDFLPPELNPFYFNDTVAWIIWWFQKEDIVSDLYMWRDEKIQVEIPNWVDTINIDELNSYQWFNQNWEWKINPEILKKVIIDENWNYYKIVQMEYDFLIKNSLPIPEIHWLDRIKLNLGFN